MIKTDGSGALMLVDGSNLHASCKLLGFNVDFKKLITCFDGDIYKAVYFTALPPADEPSSLRPLVDYIQYNGWTVITKETKEYDQVTRFKCVECEYVNVQESMRTKGNMDVELAVTAMEMAPYAKETYLFSGDGDFCYLIESLQRRHGHHVTVVSSIETKPLMCSPELRRQADHFIDLNSMREKIERVSDPTAVRPQRNWRGK